MKNVLVSCSHLPSVERSASMMMRRYRHQVRRSTFLLLAAILCASSCASSVPQAPGDTALSENAAFDEVSRSFLDDLYQRQPTWATYLGIHKYNDRLDDYSRKAVDEAVASA